MAGRFELKRGESGKYMFNLKAGNGEVILTSQQYKGKKSAENGIASVERNAPHDARFDRRAAKDGSPYFVLTATNGQVIGTSEMYSSAAAMEGGIASVRKNAPGAAVKDLTATARAPVAVPSA